MKIPVYYNQKRLTAWYRFNSNHGLDLLLAIGLAVLAAMASFQIAQLLDARIISWPAFDVWFDGDIPRVFLDLTGQNHAPPRNNVHPLFQLICFPPVYLLRWGLGFSPLLAERLTYAGIAAIWQVALYTLLRLMGCRRGDALLFAWIAAFSAAAMFWFVVPETYAFGSLTILLTLLLVAWAERQKVSWGWYVVANILTLGITVTNGIVGLLASTAAHSRSKFLLIWGATCGIGLLLLGLQKYFFPYTTLAMGGKLIAEATTVRWPDWVQAGEVIRSFFGFVMVMPMIQASWRRQDSTWATLITQHSAIDGIWGSVALGVWGLLVILGLWSLFALQQQLSLRLVLGLALLAQLLLHLIYGWETFLYTLHLLPLLLPIVALGTLTRLRPFVLVLGGILLLCLGINNSSRLASTLVLVQNNGPNPQLGQIQTGPLALSHNLELPEQLREANPKTRRFLDQGLTYFQRSDFAGAMVAYKTAWPTRPNSPEVLFRRGQVHFALRDYPRAIEDYTQVLKLNPGFAPAYSGRAEVYSDLALYPQAIQDYDQALRLDRQNGQVYFNRGGVYLAQGRQSEAIQDFQQTLLVDTDVTLRAKTFFNRGVAYLLSGKRETGLRDLRQASTLFKGLGNLYAHRMAEQMIQQAEN